MEPSTSDNSEQQDSNTYCFELLSMLTGLSQSEVGCGFLAEQNKLIQDLFTLLHVSSLRIQLQVVLKGSVNSQLPSVVLLWFLWWK